MTKLEKVLKFVRKDENGAFTWKQFIKAMKTTYPSTETNYLRMLVNAQYLHQPKRGKYEVHITPAMVSYNQLKRESKMNWNGPK